MAHFDERAQHQIQARIGGAGLDDASVEKTLTKMRELADELRQKGVRVAVLGDGQIVPLEAGASLEGPPTDLPDGVLDSSQLDCLLVVPTSGPRPCYIYACAGGLWSCVCGVAPTSCAHGLGAGGAWAEVLSARSPLFSSLKSGFRESTTR
jgi:hypothetical protein